MEHRPRTTAGRRSIPLRGERIDAHLSANADLAAAAASAPVVDEDIAAVAAVAAVTGIVPTAAGATGAAGTPVAAPPALLYARTMPCRTMRRPGTQGAAAGTPRPERPTGTPATPGTPDGNRATPGRMTHSPTPAPAAGARGTAAPSGGRPAAVAGEAVCCGSRTSSDSGPRGPPAPAPDPIWKPRKHEPAGPPPADGAAAPPECPEGPGIPGTAVIPGSMCGGRAIVTVRRQSLGNGGRPVAEREEYVTRDELIGAERDCDVTGGLRDVTGGVLCEFSDSWADVDGCSNIEGALDEAVTVVAAVLRDRRRALMLQEKREISFQSRYGSKQAQCDITFVRVARYDYRVVMKQVNLFQTFKLA